MANNFYQQLGMGVAALTFAVALVAFIYATASGIVNSLQAWLLFATSFLLILLSRKLLVSTSRGAITKEIHKETINFS